MFMFDCYLRTLPVEQAMEAAQRAIQLNPANAPALNGPVGAGMAPLSPEHLAMLTARYWGPSGVKLGVSFLDSPNQATRKKILEHANAWGQFGNITFSESNSGEVRLARAGGDGYWSYLGTDILGIPAGQPTMNLDSFTENTPESEYKRVVRHEFGHTLGCPHEHARPEIVALLDRRKTEAYFQSHYGWSPQETDQQVFVPLSPSEIRATPQADVRSIMCYDFAGEVTLSGQPIPGGTDINDQDAAFIGTLYPGGKGGGGSGGGGGGDGAQAGRVLFKFKLGRVRKGAAVWFATPQELTDGTYGLWKAGPSRRPRGVPAHLEAVQAELLD